MQLWQRPKKRNQPPSKNKILGTPGSCSTWWHFKIWYGLPCEEEREHTRLYRIKSKALSIIRRSKESANIPYSDNSISKPWIDINSLWEPLFMKSMGTLAKPTGKLWTRCRDQWQTKFGYAYRKTFAYSFGIKSEKYVKSRKDHVWIVVKINNKDKEIRKKTISPQKLHD